MKCIPMNGEPFDIAAQKKSYGDHFSVSVPACSDWKNVKLLEMDGLGPIADSTDDGYLLLPRGVGSADYSLCFFDRHKEDFVQEVHTCDMPVFGVKSRKGTYLAVMSGMSYDYTLRVECRSGVWRCYPVFELFGETPYEDVRVDYYPLEGDDADYSGMARKYRQIRIAQTGMRPLRERAKENPAVGYCKDSVMIRVRMGWKPAPPVIMHQTRENEPEMHVACTFDRVGDIMDELKRQGVEKAEIVLVGWNVRGHDGRWPETFPVEEKLGGEKALRALIAKGREMGYPVTCHTNHTDQYEIADIFDVNNTILTRDGKRRINETPWSGGEMYCICPQKGYEQACQILPRVAELGFRGVHYIDVLGVVPPRRCFDPDHYVNSRDAVEYARKMCELSRSLFGGISSEGAYDFIAPYLDYGLYISFARNKGGLCDRSVPFWQLVYHGYVLSNPYTDTVNSTFHSREAQLRLIEFGGRPSFYFYSTFLTGGRNWMGNGEPICDTDEQLADSVAKIAKAETVYRKYAAITDATMEKHEQVADNVFETTYSNGSVVRVDYNNETWEVIEK